MKLHQVKTDCNLTKADWLEHGNHLCKKRIRDVVHCIWLHCRNYAE